VFQVDSLEIDTTRHMVGDSNSRKKKKEALRRRDDRRVHVLVTSAPEAAQSPGWKQWIDY
jgi:hypothetical protein